MAARLVARPSNSWRQWRLAPGFFGVLFSAGRRRRLLRACRTVGCVWCAAGETRFLATIRFCFVAARRPCILKNTRDDANGQRLNSPSFCGEWCAAAGLNAELAEITE